MCEVKNLSYLVYFVCCTTFHQQKALQHRDTVFEKFEEYEKCVCISLAFTKNENVFFKAKNNFCFGNHRLNDNTTVIKIHPFKTSLMQGTIHI